MTTSIRFAVRAAAIIVGILLPLSLAQSAEVKSLRGTEGIAATKNAELPPKQERSQSALPRAYRQQPPLIPHKIDDYEIDLKVNQCMACHDWPRNVDVGAPKISETHYFDRDGVALDHVARTRWFCNQCHVPQVNAKPLVGNAFLNSTQVD